jgi:hypothetical protein
VVPFVRREVFLPFSSGPVSLGPVYCADFYIVFSWLILGT